MPNFNTLRPILSITLQRRSRLAYGREGAERGSLRLGTSERARLSPPLGSKLASELVFLLHLLSTSVKRDRYTLERAMMDNLRSHERGGRDTLPRHTPRVTLHCNLQTAEHGSTLLSSRILLIPGQGCGPTFLCRRNRSNIARYGQIRSRSTGVSLGNRNSRCSASLAKFFGSSAQALWQDQRTSSLRRFAPAKNLDDRQKQISATLHPGQPRTFTITPSRVSWRRCTPQSRTFALDTSPALLPHIVRVCGSGQLIGVHMRVFSDGGDAHKVLNPLSCVLVHWQMWRREQTKFGPWQYFRPPQTDLRSAAQSQKCLVDDEAKSVPLNSNHVCWSPLGPNMLDDLKCVNFAFRSLTSCCDVCILAVLNLCRSVNAQNVAVPSVGVLWAGFVSVSLSCALSLCCSLRGGGL